MGCAPTTRKRNTIPAGQIDGIASVNQNSKLKAFPSGAEKDITSIENDYNKENDRVDEREKEVKTNKRVMTSTRLVTRKSQGNVLPFADVVVKEERKFSAIEKMDFAKGEHLQP